MAEAGANVALIYNTSKDAETTAATIASENSVRAAAYKADVVDQQGIENAVQKIDADFGKLDIIVVNSGITSSIAAEDYIAAQWRDIMKVNLDGAFYSAQAAARTFKKQGFGNVIFTASVSATLVNVPQKQAAVRLPCKRLNDCTVPLTATVQCFQSRRGPNGQMSIGGMG